MLKKKTLASIFGGLVLFKFFDMSSVDVMASENKGVVNVTTTLRLRKEPNTSSSILYNIKNNEEVTILSVHDSWYKVSYKGMIGFVYKSYIEEKKSSFEDYTGVVHGVTTSLNFRTEPNISGKIIDSIPNGVSLNIIGKSGDWLKTNYDGKVGYVHSSFIKKSSSSVGNQVIKNIGYANVSSNGWLNVRSKPDSNSMILGKYNRGQAIDIEGEIGDWLIVDYLGKTAYVHSSFVVYDDIYLESDEIEVGRVFNVSTSLRVRKESNTSSSIIGYLLNGESVSIIGESNNFYKIKFKESYGYVSKNYVTKGSEYTNTYDIILEEMKSHIGSPYVWGGDGSPLTHEYLDFKQSYYGNKYDHARQYVGKNMLAFDCSGLMQYAFRKAGVNISRTTYTQINDGYEVNINDVKPGDLLFSADIGHVGMYIGDGKWIESPKTGSYIRIVDVPWGYVTRARRIL